MLINSLLCGTPDHILKLTHRLEAEQRLSLGLSLRKLNTQIVQYDISEKKRTYKWIQNKDTVSSHKCQRKELSSILHLAHTTVVRNQLFPSYYFLYFFKIRYNLNFHCLTITTVWNKQQWHTCISCLLGCVHHFQ